MGEGSATAVTIDLSSPVHRQALAKRIHADIDAWCAEHYDDGHRTHLGASLIGRECSRELWYTFRWVKHKKFDGRMQRLFQRGHLEEGRFIEYLEGIGAEVTFVDLDATPKIDENGDEVYPQMRISACGGHFGGSLDAEVTLPERYNVGPLVFVNEFKTSGTGAGYNNMVKDGVQATKYEHFCQMSIYGWKRNRKYGLYMMTNKNDDSIHVEIVALDWELAQRLEAKADRIIQSPTPPAKISETITFKQCSYCDMNDVCHKSAPYEKNCRSCRQCQPVADKQWYCHQWKAAVPVEAIPVGCDSWTPAV